MEGFFSIYWLVWRSLESVCTCILHACQAMCVLMQSVGHWFVFELAQRRASTVFKRSRSHLGRNPLRVKSIPQRFHAGSPSMLPSSRLPRALSGAWVHRCRTRSRKSPRWWSQSRGGRLMITMCWGDRRCYWKHVNWRNDGGRKCATLTDTRPAWPGSPRLWVSKSLIRRVFVLSFVLRSTRTPFASLRPPSRNAGEAAAQCLPLCAGKSITLRRVMLDQSGAETKSVSDRGVD